MISNQSGSRYPSVSVLGAALALGACGVTDLGDPAAGELAGDEAALHGGGGGGAPSPGAAGIGDPLFPGLGNGGYEVDHYHLDLRYATAAPTQAIDGTVTIWARATQALSRFNLDFAGTAVGAVRVDGRPAAYQWDGEELVITPARPLKRGEIFSVTVSDFAATPVVPSPDEFLAAPFFVTADGSAWAAQPNNAHRIFPSNDHPRDKATFTFQVDVPAGTTAVANGELLASYTAGSRAFWWYLQREPMATELAQLAVGAYAITERGEQGDVLLRDVTPARLGDALEPQLAEVIPQLDWLRERLGAYPFQTYGSLVVDAALGFALETQTLSIYETTLFDAPPEAWRGIMVHELAHQWFGNSVAPSAWSDLWQSEGHATWYQITYSVDPDSPEFHGPARLIYSLGDIWRAFFGPVAAPLSGDPELLFNPNVYYGGALVLYALRQQVGDPAFQAIERAWVTRYRGRSASTADFIALASEISGQDLTQFLGEWLYGTTTPPMPGHPDWTVDPVPGLLTGKVRSPTDVPMKGLPRIHH